MSGECRGARGRAGRGAYEGGRVVGLAGGGGARAWGPQRGGCGGDRAVGGSRGRAAPPCGGGKGSRESRCGEWAGGRGGGSQGSAERAAGRGATRAGGACIGVWGGPWGAGGWSECGGRSRARARDRGGGAAVIAGDRGGAPGSSGVCPASSQSALCCPWYCYSLPRYTRRMTRCILAG